MLRRAPWRTAGEHRVTDARIRRKTRRSRRFALHTVGVKKWQRVRALGDSGSVMRGLDGAGAHGRDDLLTWVDRVGLALRAVTTTGSPGGAHPGGGVDVASYAREGARVADACASQVLGALADRANLVTLMAGTHELVSGRGRPEPLAALVDAAVARLRSASADVVLITPLRPPEAFAGHERVERTAEFTSELWWIARTRGATVVDAWSIPHVHVRPRGALESLTLDATGHRLLARRVIEALDIPYRDGLLPPLSEPASRLPG